jgi:hypothetical protein
MHRLEVVASLVVPPPHSSSQTSMRAPSTRVDRTRRAQTWHRPQHRARAPAMSATPVMASRVAVCMYLFLDTIAHHSPEDLDACLNNPCGINAQCTDLAPPSNEYTCQCKSGFEGNAYFGCARPCSAFLFNPTHLFRGRPVPQHHVPCQRTV